MHGDFSILHFDPREHERGVTPLAQGVLRNINGVLHQQGRVITDADLTEGELLELSWNGQAGRDIIGAGVCAVPAAAPQSFRVESALVSGGEVHISVRPGRAWADGLLSRLAGSAADPTAAVERRARYFGPPLTNPLPQPSSIGEDTRDAVVLEVSEEELHGFQYPDRLIEPALGGPDTSERSYVNIRFRLLRLAEGEDCASIRDRLKDDPSSKGRLSVSLAPVTVIAGDCPVVGGGGYLGFEHNLYRIEIADGEPSAPARFKWSQWNGGLVGRGRFDATLSPARVVIDAGRTAILNSGLTEFYPEALQYDELDGAWNVVFGTTATLNTEHDLELSAPPTYGALPATTEPVFFRLWNGLRDITDFTNAANPVELRDGIRLVFDAPGVGNYQSRDYWTFAVRAGEIPNAPVLLDQAPPTGIVYHRVPLALLNWTSTPANAITFDGGEIFDCRRVFQPLTDLSSCCTFTVGDGIHSSGHFNSVEEALRHLPQSGGRLCLLPGVHSANTVLDGRKNIHITGCGDRTIVQPAVAHADEPIFALRSCVDVRIDELTLLAPTGSAIELVDAKDATQASRRITIARNRIVACVHAIDLRVRNQVAGNNAIRIEDNRIAMLDKAEGGVAIFTRADDVLIERNKIVVVPAPGQGGPEDPRDEDDPSGDWYDRCPESEKMLRRQYAHTRAEAIYGYIAQVVYFPQLSYSAQGGIQIGGGSEQVRIINNTVIGGWGHGITLGDVPSLIELYEDAADGVPAGIRYYEAKRPFIDEMADQDLLGRLQDRFNAYLYAIAIEDNRIQNMGMSGISVAVFTNLDKIGLLVHAQDITIYRNQIMNCVLQIPEERPVGMPERYGFGGIALASCENVMIQENRIEHNGRSQLEPICGVLILYGEKIDISNNRILDNGPRGFEDDARAISGVRGGIVIRMSFKQVLTSVLQDTEAVLADGIPAARIHDNVVTQPLGQALFLLVLGPVSVVGNQFTSQGADYRVNLFSGFAGTVLIVNLGVSKDLLTMLLLARFKLLATNNARLATTHATVAGTTTTNPLALLRLLFYFPDGHTLFANNQVKLDLRSLESNFAFSSQLIASLDDVSYLGNQSEVSSVFLPGYSFDVVFTDVALYGVTLRSNDNRFQEGFTVALNSLFSYGFLNTAVGNQATHCMKVYGAKRVYAGNLAVYDADCPAEYVVIGKAIFIPEEKLAAANPA